MLEIFKSAPTIVFCLIICVCKIIEVGLSSLKSILMVKGQRFLATGLALIECLVWGFVIAGTIKDLSSNYYWLAAYCAGYTLGWFIGSTIESKLALGTTNVQFIVTSEDLPKIETYLAEHELGYIVTDCRGKNGPHHKVDVVLARKRAAKIRKGITKLCESTIFVTNYDVPYARGGYGVRDRK
jgi:uncharacterized protein YebE (UPF0316 family)